MKIITDKKWLRAQRVAYTACFKMLEELVKNGCIKQKTFEHFMEKNQVLNNVKR